ncbi:fumarylacetoacetate hydrolase family protein [Conexibacter woesei]|uniref:5-carboxymethyl-2-hydroxymuconateDelta-isomerase n=1 Tax=Conexibacter woesei (strain DSM 14684 / CCUG 47730 / CIP 108061 / JCM 11494 / NBRC 100937 / ID131577) TaxID=469383 RepID=D3F3E4_CONWI|nr:fumarylacetoacetate hydrolase family protein [Conexibacter woesei]ADB52309.1 5-carboxymethyl-2-hydroxymuconateDelta-isomerase [Conexibacter woesei DSM 14684]
MRLARALLDGAPRAGVVEEDRFVPLASGVSVDDVVRGAAVSTDGAGVPLADVRLLAPLTRFNRDVLCTGWNYWDHFAESSGKREGQDPADRPRHPTFFTKGPDTVIGPADDVAFDARLSQKWDYEAEVVLVIGRDGRSIPEERAWEHVFGFCVANDVSQRDLQREHGGQWLKGKSIDGTMPLGPWITTADDVPDPHDLRIVCELNGETMQNASTAQVAFRFERLIAELSRGMTLRAGDIVLTGTPSGIGNAREPQVFLDDGDVIVTKVEGLGELRNNVVAVELT